MQLTKSPCTRCGAMTYPVCFIGRRLVCWECFSAVCKRHEAIAAIKRSQIMINAVPDTWLDSLLSGPDRVINPGPDLNGKDIERLLNALRKRMEKIAAYLEDTSHE